MSYLIISIYHIEDDTKSFIEERAAVVIDDVADFPTMFVPASRILLLYYTK